MHIKEGWQEFVLYWIVHIIVVFLHVLRIDRAKLSYCLSSWVCCSGSVLCGVGANDDPYLTVQVFVG